MAPPSTLSRAGGEETNPQLAHYATIAEDYHRHYGDPTALAYRDQFWLDPLFGNMNLDGCDIADLACGAGYTTAAIRRRWPTARVTGYDLSPVLCAAYTAQTGCPAIPCDLTASALPPASVDVAVMVGGLHHCVANLPATLQTIATIVRPGGIFACIEPNADCWYQGFRSTWYQADRYFEPQTEAALSHPELVDLCREDFDVIDVSYQGGPAYFLILNSLVCRIPVRLKPLLASPLFTVERVWDRGLRSARWSPVFIARWRRRDRGQPGPRTVLTI